MVMKRTFDIVASALGMVVLFPLFPLIALAIKLDTRGPVFYSQIRVGHDRRKFNGIDYVGQERRKLFMPGKLFTMYKFRSMSVDAEPYGPQWCTKGDIRITRVGKVIRATHIDELPQLWNVLVGDMSLVGPRPERPVFVGRLQRKVPRYTQRHQVLPGITGLAQVVNGYDDSVESVRRKVYYDMEYIERATFIDDLKIMLATVHLFPKKGLRGGNFSV